MRKIAPGWRRRAAENHAPRGNPRMPPPSWRAACLLLAVMLPAVLAPPHVVRAAEASPAPRAVWTWEEASYAMLGSDAAAREAFAFLRARQVDTLYLYADAFAGRNLIVEQPQRYRDFIAEAHRNGFRVYALLGSAPLKTEEYVLPRHRAKAMAMLQRVLDYNAAAPEASRFDGVNLDIEPHLLDAWDTQRMALLAQWLDVSAAWMELKRASGQGLPIGPAMPFWFDNIPLEWRGVVRPVSEHAADLYDYVALMDYRNKAGGRDGIVAHAEDEMAYAAKVGKRVVIGLELGRSDPPKVTFRGLTEADLAREMAETEAAYRDSPAFGGFVLHHYDAWREWVQDSERESRDDKARTGTD